jgi:methylaspartate ammonia-lyase
MRQVLAELSRLKEENARLQLQIRAMQDAGEAQAAQIRTLQSAGESLADEQCLYIDADDQQCTSQATQLLIDSSGMRCPVCDVHAAAAPPELRRVRGFVQ